MRVVLVADHSGMKSDGVHLMNSGSAVHSDTNSDGVHIKAAET